MSPVTRRDLGRTAAVAMLAGALAAAPARAEITGDAAVVQRLHRMEMALLEAYVVTARDGPGAAHDLTAMFRNHETKHVAALATSLEALGAPRLPPPRGPAALDREARRLGIGRGYSVRRGARDLLAFHAELETVALREWTRAHGALEGTALTELAGQILACQAQHLFVLRRALGREPLPHAVDAGA